MAHFAVQAQAAFAQAGDILGGDGVIEQEKMDAMQAAAGAEPILNVLPMQAKKVGIITTGSEVFKGRIEDKFTPILQRSWLSTAARWFSTRSAMTTLPGSPPPFWKQGRRV